VWTRTIVTGASRRTVLMSPMTAVAPDLFPGVPDTLPRPMAPVMQLDHTAVAVHSIRDALRLYRDALGGEYLMGGDQDTWRWLQVRFRDGGKVELLEPLGEGFLSRFLEKHGEGLHHMTFKTDDLPAAIEHVQGLGYELVDIQLDDPHWREAFLRPSGAHGTLIQLAWSSQPDEVAAKRLRPADLERILG
jgi:methylmalonyl-CoA/ethylmalonyl-CoA epimerase